MATTTIKRPPKYRSRATAPRDYWKKKGPKITVPSYTYRLWAVRGTARWLLSGHVVSNGKAVSKGYVTGFSWDDSRPITTGSLSAREPGLSGKDLKLQSGDLIVCEYGSGARPAFRELWRMRCWSPGQEIASGTWTYELASDLQRLDESYDDFKFLRDKLHAKGWLGHEIIAFICKQYGIEAVIPKMKHRFKKLVWVGDADERRSVYALIVHVLKVEREHHHTKLRMDMVGRVLRITPFERNAQILELGPTLLDGTLQGTKHERFATSVRVSNLKADEVGTDAKGNRKVKHRKIVTIVTSAAAVRRFGLTRRRVYSPSAETVQQAIAQGQQFIAEVIREKKELTLSHPDIPSLRRGDAIRVDLGEAAGVKRIVYVKEGRHSVEPGSATMELVLSWEDIYVEQKGLLIDEALTDVAHERQRVTPTTSTSTVKAAPKPKGAETKAAKPAGVAPMLGSTSTPVAGK